MPISLSLVVLSKRYHAMRESFHEHNQEDNKNLKRSSVDLSSSLFLEDVHGPFIIGRDVIQLVASRFDKTENDVNVCRNIIEGKAISIFQEGRTFVDLVTSLLDDVSRQLLRSTQYNDFCPEGSFVLGTVGNAKNCINHVGGVFVGKKRGS
jgi:hypothetical protein